MPPPWFVAPSPIQGHGVFARVPLVAKTSLGLAHWYDGRRWHWTALGRWHNHSPTPNAKSVLVGSRRYLVTLRDIRPGEEITVDYRLQPDLEQPQLNWA